MVSIHDLVDDADTTFADERLVAGDDCGVLIDDLTGGERTAWLDKVGHVREVLTGYRSGLCENPQPGEPSPMYSPGVTLSARCESKAGQLGVSVRTVRRWLDAYRRDGPAGLIDRRCTALRPVLDTLDQRWIDMCRAVCDELRYEATHTKKYVLFEVESRLRAEYGTGVVDLPAKTTAYDALNEITRGTNMFHGSAKGRREIAERPEGLYGHLRATRLGEYVILDTTRLDVYAMDRLTHEWVNTELTAAMDVYGRIICGLRLAPLSTKSADVASVLFEVVCPRSADDPTQLPFIGLPESLLVPTGGPEGNAVRTATVCRGSGTVLHRSRLAVPPLCRRQANTWADRRRGACQSVDDRTTHCRIRNPEPNTWRWKQNRSDPHSTRCHPLSSATETSPHGARSMVATGTLSLDRRSRFNGRCG
ncbi:helix-turn-helix domain-containing protein [Rhodococcus hoagii]|nr:helix-turn-helix domain-containing protein [Prescottella equi]